MRIEGRNNGDVYELVQDGKVKAVIASPHSNKKLRRAIQQNGWEPLS